MQYQAISSRALALGLGLVGSIIIIICSFFYVRLTQTVNGEVDRYLFEVANGISANVNFRVRATFRTLESIGETALKQHYSGQAAHDFLKDKADMYGYKRISVMDSEGNSTFSDGRIQSMDELPNVSAALREGKKQVARLRKSPIDGTDGVVYVSPVYADGKIIGVICAWNDLDHLRKAFQLPYFGGEGFSQLSDSQGDVIISAIHKNAPADLRNIFNFIENRGRGFDAAMLEAMRTGMSLGERGSLNFELRDGAEMTMRYVPLEQEGLYLLSIVPRQAVEQKFTSLMHEALFINAAIVILFIALLLSIYTLYKRSAKTLSKVAFVDPVTGGCTRAKFNIEARKKISVAPPGAYALLSLNVDKFKLVNHIFGIEAGNKMLKAIHDSIMSCMDEEELLCRDYADEYILLIKNETKEKIFNNIEKISKTINEFNQNKENKYYLRLSLGVYCIENPFTSIVDMQDRAVLARKSNKAVIKGDLYRCVFYSDIEHSQIMKFKDIENKMEDALASEDFLVYFQPKFGLESHKVEGAEALVRWNDKNSGLISPQDFLPFFESNGFITKLDLYVFEKVCQCIRKWLDSGVSAVPISVNISRAHMMDPDFLGKYVSIRDKYAIPAGLLEMEVTDSPEFENMELVTVVNQLHGAGFRCSLDDFGCGYSSLNTLKDINVDTLKLDSAFWESPQPDKKKERDIIESVVNLAKKLKMTTVAEGVETLAQVAFLRKIHCDMVQGFVFSKPVPSAMFEKIAYGKTLCPLEENMPEQASDRS